jgi:hypothetical protein
MGAWGDGVKCLKWQINALQKYIEMNCSSYMGIGMNAIGVAGLAAFIVVINGQS